MPFGSQAEKDLLSVRGFYHRPTKTIHLRPAATLGLALRLAIARLSSPAYFHFFGGCLTDGTALYFANLVLREQELEAIKPEDHAAQLMTAEDLIGAASRARVVQAYFQNPAELVKHLRTRLSIGPVGAEELAVNALCRTNLLRTAVFASRQLKNMVGVGITWPRAVRLWLRTEVAGAHELQISGGKGGVKKINLTVPAGRPGDNTLALTYPANAGQTPLEPLTRYRYRVVRTSDRTPLGEGSFETAPALEQATPQKVVIGVMSCHQPFTGRGTVGAEQARMLRLIPRILRENQVKFMLLAGDQIYADYPSDFSLFNNPYLIRRIAPGKKSIFECTTEEVRRIYAMRYRIFWSMPAMRQMYANYPCYPAMDDHEITDDWGSMPEHASERFRHIRDGARLAYMDYQASSVLPSAVKQLPKSFHYHFDYGNVGVFVMDIRSERTAGARHQLYGDEQLNDLRLFLDASGGKKVLLIVSSVPVVHLGGWLTDLGHRITGPDVDFLDQWSFKKNIPSRDAFLSLLHRHQQAHPDQRIAVVSGDVHISSAFSINWQGGNKPRLYQFTSSAVTNPLKGWRADFSKVGPHLLTGIGCRRTKFGGACSGRVGLLPAARGGARNPLSELNLGLIEIERHGDKSNLKFKLVGCHPAEDRAITYFESGWLG